MKRFLPLLCLLAVLASQGFGQTPTKVRLMAANLNGNTQSYQPFALRILAGLKPDVVCLQEFNYADNSPAQLRYMVTNTLGTDYTFYRETNPAYRIPNGIVSRYPILASGSWDDTTTINDRGYAWAQLDVPGTQDLYAVSVHLKSSSGSASQRALEAEELKNLITARFPAGAWIVVAGDLNVFSDTEPVMIKFNTFLNDTPEPASQDGDKDTNAPRSHRYDRILTSPSLTARFTPVMIGSNTFPNGLVFDSRTYTPLADVAPVQQPDSGLAQHMAVVKDFALPATTTATNPPTAPRPPTGLRVIQQ